uniref:BZIP domain-containing protein n=1 Tax=Elaeophora elaphi TaxID=1147741 RepID=A0A0R3RK37_9BILA
MQSVAEVVLFLRFFKRAQLSQYVEGTYVMMSSCTSFFIFLSILLAFARHFINSESFVPPPAYIFSGSSDFDLNQRNQISDFNYDMDQISNFTSDNLPFFPLLRKQKKSSQPYRNQEELTDDIYKTPEIINMNKLAINEALIRSFRDDNFGENYRRINETYFLQGFDADEKSPYKSYTQSPSTAQLSSTTTPVNRISPQPVAPSSTLLSTLSLSVTAIISDDFAVTASSPSDNTKISNLSSDNSNIIDEIRTNSILSNDNDGENEKLALSEAHFTTLKNESQLAITPSTLKPWEMHRTNSGQSIIKVTTALTSTKIIENNELHHISGTGTGNTIDDDGDDDNSHSNDLNSNGGDQSEFSTSKENSLLPLSINQSAITVSNISTNDMPIPADNLAITTATIRTITDSKFLTTTLFPNRDQKIQQQSSIAKIDLTSDVINFGLVETIPAKSLTINETNENLEDLTLNTKKTNSLSGNLPLSAETEPSSSLAFHHWKTSGSLP